MNKGAAAKTRFRLRGMIDGRDLYLYPGIAAFGAGVGLGWGLGPGIAATGLILLLIGVFGLPDLNREESSHGNQ